MRKLKHITEVCKEIYEKQGFSAVCDYANKLMKTSFDIQYENCKACNTEAPAWRHICLACGQTTTPIPLPLPEQLRAEAQELIDLGDSHEKREGAGMLKVLDAIGSITAAFCPEPIYFHVISSGWNGDLQRQEVEINAGDNGKVMLIKTEQGFIIDVYGQNDNVFTETVWEDDLIGDDGIELDKDDDGNCKYCGQKCWEGQMCDEQQAGGFNEESNDPRNFSDVEVEEWKQNWGQSHGEITSELGFPRSHAEADELILNTGNYFWDEKDKKWYNRYASLFTDRERAIADYLYYLNQNE